MKRIEFIRKSALSFLVLNGTSVFELFGNSFPGFSGIHPQPAEIDNNLQKDFNELCVWLTNTGWNKYLGRLIGKDGIDFANRNELCEPVENQTLIYTARGFDDFGGNKLIEPGNPSLSLLYHALASPRVKDPSLSYPTLSQLDLLENYIYALKKWEDYLQDSEKENLHLMILSYEYRPAFKTPALGLNSFEYDFPKHAQMVFSRTGISRIGNRAEHYDAEKRSYTNQPLDSADAKNIAVTSARFGLFLVELVPIEKSSRDRIKVMNFQDREFTTFTGSVTRLPRHFIRPVRKIFSDDTMSISFGESHVNEKLYKFSQFELHGKKIASVNESQQWDLTSAPFKRISCTDDEGRLVAAKHNSSGMVNLKRAGSSVLLSPVPDDLVRVATQNGRSLSFFVEPKWDRRYSALKLTNNKNLDTHDSVITEFFFRTKRRTSLFRAMRNAPLFVNIKYRATPDGPVHIDETDRNMECTIKDGGYNALLFEDSMCDGCISAKITFTQELSDPWFQLLKSAGKVKPAFSLVAAPDFFPYLDSNDIARYYQSNLDEYKVLLKKQGRTDQEQQQIQQQLDTHSITNDEHFLEGGSLNLSGIRQRGNPEISDPFTGTSAFAESWTQDKSFDTFVAVVSTNDKIPALVNKARFRDNFRRDYVSNSHLPDTGTGVFFPGWDATYSGEKINPYFGTFGLGSPFPEDMKLCAAANGMWPVASPDAGRTFQGSLEKFPVLGKPNTSIPLMDDEIGFHSGSPHVKDHGKRSSYGWDGEQGPCLQIKDKVYVNFTDIGRSDYVANVLNPAIGFDMSRLRNLDSGELINRMDCLRLAIKLFDNTIVSKTKYWLVSAEKVKDWSKGAEASGVPQKLIGDNNGWVNKNSKLSGPGYLFVFALTKPGKIHKELESPTSKRRNQAVSSLRVVRVAQATHLEFSKAEWCEIDRQWPRSENEIQWLTTRK